MKRKQSNISEDSISSRLRKKVKTEDKSEQMASEGNLERIVKVNDTIKTMKSRGFNSLFRIQETTYQVILEKKDIIAKDRTGSGKTLGFLLPSLDQMRLENKFEENIKQGRRNQLPLILILLPTRELAIQVFNETEKMRNYKNEYKSQCIYGGVDLYTQKDNLANGCDIVVGTPGRIIDLVERKALQLEKIKLFILDEADRMLDMGFQEDIEKIFNKIHQSQQDSKKFQTLLFSATMPRWVYDISSKYMNKDRKFIDMVAMYGNQTNQKIQHLAINCPFHQRTQVIGDVVLMYSGKHCRTIIFTETKKEANDIMMNSNIKQETQVLHGDIPQKQREITFQGFREGKFKCLIATNVVARGLDIPEVELIIQLDPPKELDSYIHRAGRTARAGRQGACITFYTQKQIGLLERIERKCQINFQRIGTPQPQDIIKASARDVIQGMQSVQKEVYEIFLSESQDLIKQMEPEVAIAKLLAYISGHTQTIKQRSFLCALEGFVTFQIESQVEMRSQGYIWNFLRNNFDNEFCSSVKGMKMFKDKMGVVFDIDAKYEDQLTQFMNSYTKDDIKISKCQELPQLQEENSYGNSNSRYGNNNSMNGGRGSYNNSRNSSQQQRGGYQGNKAYEIFIGGIAGETSENDLYAFFDKQGIGFDRLNYLSDKGVAFGTCKSLSQMEKALNISDKLRGRKLRINKSGDRR